MILVGVTGVIVLVLYLGVRSGSEPTATEQGQRACIDAMRSLTSALNGSASPEDAARAMEVAAEPIGPLAAEYPRLAVIAFGIEQSRQEVLAGRPSGPMSRALIRECERLGR